MSDGLLTYIEEKPSDVGGRLGRNVVWHDPKNRAYPVRSLLGDAPLVSRSWWARHVFDQGNESSCTAQAASGVVFTSPFRMELERSNLQSYDEAAERYELYRAAQKVDPWPGESYEGSSTDAPFRVLRDGGQISEWRWAFGLDDVLRTLSHHGPVAIGTNWYAGMDRPDSKGFVKAEGSIRGGHAYELYGINVAGRFVRARNSWGPSWGVKGLFLLSFDTLDRLLREDGEAVTVVL